MNCTRCNGTGFLNVEQIPQMPTEGDVPGQVLRWMESHKDHDVQICDCCGTGAYWYGEPGQHYGAMDPQGKNGPYAYNGGLCECN